MQVDSATEPRSKTPDNNENGDSEEEEEEGESGAGSPAPPMNKEKVIDYKRFLSPMTELADSGDFDGDGVLTWSDSLATNTVIVEHHLNNVRKILKIPEVGNNRNENNLILTGICQNAGSL